MLTLNSYAKLNLYLSVRNKRKDNYHNIETIFERINLADKIILTSRKDSLIKINCSNPRLPDDASNLAFRSAKLLQESLNLNKGVNIKIVKRIPIGSGLGGGSSNAAAVVTGLNKLWELHLSQKKLVAFGAKVGSDVPFFLYNCPFASGKGRGDRITPLRGLNKVRLWHILIVPKICVSTPLIYKNWDKLKGSRDENSCPIKLTPPFLTLKGRPSYTLLRKGLSKRDLKIKERAGLTGPKYGANIIYLALRKNDFRLFKEAIFNSLEPVTTALYPEVLRIKAKLLQLGLQSILMSGSGPAVFALVSSRKEAVGLCRLFKKESRFWQVFLTWTV